MKVVHISQVIILLVVLIALAGSEIPAANGLGEFPAAWHNLQSDSMRSDLKLLQVGAGSTTASSNQDVVIYLPLVQRKGAGYNVDYIGRIAGGSVYAVAMQESLAYVGEGASMTVLDVSSPGSPIVVGRTTLFPDIVSDIVVAGEVAYVAAADGGLRVIDVSDPAQPSEMGFSDTPDSAQGVAITGTLALVADRETGLRIIDVSNPSHPRVIGFFDTPGKAMGLAVSGEYAFVADGEAGLRVIDISDPGNPIEVGFFATAWWTRDVAVSGDFAYLLGDGLLVIDITDPAHPIEVGSLDTLVGEGLGLTLEGELLYIAEDVLPILPSISDGGGLRIIDVSDPSNPTELSFYDTPGLAYNVAEAGGVAYIAGGYNGLRIIDVSDSMNPVESGSYNMPKYADEVILDGKIAYIADWVYGMRVVDLSDPTQAREIGFYDKADHSGSVLSLDIAGNYAYVGKGNTWWNGSDGGLLVVDISDPANPFEVGFYTNSNTQYIISPEAVEVAGDYAYVADYCLHVIDISNPASPSYAGFFDPAGSPGDVAVVGDYAYVANGYGLLVLDITDPLHPIEIGSIDTPGYAYNLALAGGYAYVVDGDGGLRVIDVSDPAHLVEVGFYVTGDYARDVTVAGDIAYVADWTKGLRVINISDPAHPVEVGFYKLPYTNNLAVAGSYAILTGQDMGMVILNYTGIKDKTTTTISSHAPNPSTMGGSFTVFYKVSAGFGVPSGEVTVTVKGDVASCSGALVDGVGSCQLTLTEAGSYTLVATYGGDRYFQTSTATVEHSVVSP